MIYCCDLTLNHIFSVLQALQVAGRSASSWSVLRHKHHLVGIVIAGHILYKTCLDWVHEAVSRFKETG